jgi:hypothetical protein
MISRIWHGYARRDTAERSQHYEVRERRIPGQRVG